MRDARGREIKTEIVGTLQHDRQVIAEFGDRSRLVDPLNGMRLFVIGGTTNSASDVNQSCRSRFATLFWHSFSKNPAGTDLDCDSFYVQFYRVAVSRSLSRCRPSMPLYYFDLDECGVVTPDEEGSEIESITVATAQAIAAARGIMASEVEHGAVCLDCHIDILDMNREHVRRIAFAHVLRVTGGGLTASQCPTVD